MRSRIRDKKNDEMRFQSNLRAQCLTPEAWLRLRGMTRREAEATLLAGRGMAMQAIAEHMQVTSGTVKTLLARAREKLGCANVRELMIVLLCEGLVKTEELLDPRESEWRDRLTDCSQTVDKKSTCG